MKFWKWRGRQDSNLRAADAANGFQDRRLKPLGHVPRKTRLDIARARIHGLERKKIHYLYNKLLYEPLEPAERIELPTC